MTAPAPLAGATDKTSWLQPRRAQLLILMLGLVHGLVYAFVVPPWQHYDEPSHLEYVLLISRRGRLPKPGDIDLGIRREISSSMAATGFYRGQSPAVIDYWSDVPPSIGADELVHPPLYYLLLAVATRPFAHQSVEVQLYIGRLCSVGLYQVVLVAAFGLVAECFPHRRWLPVGIGLFLALLPPFVDRMSSINNDVGATLAATLMLWAAASVARRGPSWLRAALFLGSAALCLATKATAANLALALACVLVASCVRGRSQRWLLPVLGGLLAGMMSLLLLAHRQAAYWYSASPPGASNLTAIQTPLDNSALVVGAQESATPAAIVQELPVDLSRTLRGRTVTLGAWVRSPLGSEGRVQFALDEGTEARAWGVRTTADWELHQFAATVGQDARGLSLRVGIAPGPGSASQVYLDGIFLVESALSAQGPAIRDARASRVSLDGRELPNLLRNGSAERSWLRLPRPLGDLIVGRSSAAEILYSLWDLPRTDWVLLRELQVLFKSFWGGFGWNHLELPEGFFWAILPVSVAGLAGSLLGIARRRCGATPGERGRGRVCVILAAALVVGWGMALLRTYPVFVTMRIWWPVARYADVVIVPSAIVFCAGLAEIVPRRWAREATWAGLGALTALDAVALGLVIAPYYYG